MQHILLVDDDTHTLAALKREFLARKDEFEVEAHFSAKKALTHAGKKPFDVVISDFKMPEMDGVAFTKAIWEIQHDTACIIMSDKADRDELVQTTHNVLRSRQLPSQAEPNLQPPASNRSHILRFLNKPWDEIGLASVVAQALSFRKAMVENHRLATQHGRLGKTAEPDKHYQILVVEDQNSSNAVAHSLTHHTPFSGLHDVLRHKIDLESRHDHTDYRFIVETSTSPHEALKLAERIPYDIVITDYHLSEIDGTHFLEKFREIQPHAPRMLLSGQTETRILIDAINRFGVYGFIGKQWSSHDLKNAVIQAIPYRNLLLENSNLLNFGANRELSIPG